MIPFERSTTLPIQLPDAPNEDMQGLNLPDCFDRYAEDQDC